MLSEVTPLRSPGWRVTPVSGKEALGKWRAPHRKHRLDSVPGNGDNLTRCRAGGITTHPRGVYGRAFKLRDVGEGPAGTCCCRQPDSGNPTVRDERGGLRKRELWQNEEPAAQPKGCKSETLCLRLRASYFYPTPQGTAIIP